MFSTYQVCLIKFKPKESSQLSLTRQLKALQKPNLRNLPSYKQSKMQRKPKKMALKNLKMLVTKNLNKKNLQLLNRNKRPNLIRHKSNNKLLQLKSLLKKRSQSSNNNNNRRPLLKKQSPRQLFQTLVKWTSVLARL